MAHTYQLATIMFTDIVGYTALMGKDEKKSLAILQKNKEIHQKYLKKYGGKWLKEMGDGVLASFHNVTDAVYCAGAIMNEVELAEQFHLRIGINLGEIVMQGTEIYGDGVNIASRIQGQAESGQILVSESIYNNIKNKEGIESLCIGSFNLKNVESEIVLYAINIINFPSKSFIAKKKYRVQKKAIIGIIIFFCALIAVFLFVDKTFQFDIFRAPNTQNASLYKSIAVLPFINMSGDPEQSYFSDGITEDVITELGKVRNISTFSRNTSFNYKGTKKPVKQIASEIGAALILSGSIRRELDKVRVNVQLIDPYSDKNVWSESFDREVKYILDIQKDIAVNIAGALNITISEQDRGNLNDSGVKNFEAYDLFLKARDKTRDSLTVDVYRRSQQYLDEALSIEPDFPEALTLWAYIQEELTYLAGMDKKENARLANEKLERALILRPNYGDAYIVKGSIKFYLEWKMKEAQDNFYKGWQLSEYGKTPISVCYCPIIETEYMSGNPEKALKMLRSIEKYDPYYPYRENQLFFIYEAQGNLDGMREIAKNPKQSLAVPAYMYALGQYDSLIQYVESQFDRAWIPNNWLSSMIVISYFKTGNNAKGNALLKQMIELSQTERNLAYFIARVYSATGDRLEAIKWLQVAYEQNDYWLYALIWNSEMKTLLADPKVKEIVDGIWGQ